MHSSSNKLIWVVKAVAEPIKNTSWFEQSVLSSPLIKTLSCENDDYLGDGLLGRTQRLPGLGIDVLVSDALRCIGVDFDVDYVLLRGQVAGFARVCTLQGGELFLFVAPLLEE